MPGIDGIQLAREIKAQLPDTEIVILTGYDDFTYAQQALREGVTDYLLKTSRPEEIIKAALKAKQNVMDKWETMKQDNLQQAALRNQLLDRALKRGLHDDAEAREQLRVWFQRNGVEVHPESGSAAAMQVMLVSVSGWEAGLTELLQGAAQNILFELLPCVTLMNKEHLLLVVRYESSGTDQAGLKSALKRVTETLKCTAFAALGTTAQDYESLRDSYLAAKKFMPTKGCLVRRVFSRWQISGSEAGPYGTHREGGG